MKQIEKEEKHTQETYSVENYVINNCYLVDYSSYYSHATFRAESLDGKLRFDGCQSSSPLVLCCIKSQEYLNHVFEACGLGN